jgi:hypothetical protein
MSCFSENGCLMKYAPHMKSMEEIQQAETTYPHSASSNKKEIGVLGSKNYHVMVYDSSQNESLWK